MRGDENMEINLSRRIALLVAVLIVIVSIGMGVIGLKFSSKVILGQVEEALLQIAEEGGVRHIEAVITKDLTALQELSNNEKIQSMDWEIQRMALRGRC